MITLSRKHSITKKPAHSHKNSHTHGTQNPVACQDTMSLSPYDLRSANGTSDRFYAELKLFSETVSNHLSSYASSILDQYAYFVTEDLKEKFRSNGEYGIEFLSLGIMWNRYSGAAAETSTSIVHLLKHLYTVRQRIPRTKPYIDWLRGVLTSQFVIKHLDKKNAVLECNRSGFEIFVKWLDATGEFKDEVKRFTNWLKFFATLTDTELVAYMHCALEVARWFELEAKNVLGQYTQDVASFLKNVSRNYNGREDRLFCSKEATEYYLNMVASEIMNTSLKNEYTSTNKRVVLVPGCMRKMPETQCKAKVNGFDVSCTGCNETCHVNRISNLGKVKNFTTYIIPHSSRFTQWLKRWENTIEYGVIAVACPLNIAVGGYEMRELNIPSQCVMLDYCGCRKHWHPEGIPTDVNDSQIVRKLGDAV